MKTLIVLLLACGVACGTAHAALDISEIGVGARPLGMGKAFIAAANDASAVFMNPAGLAFSDNPNLVSMAGSLLGDVNYLMLGASDLSPAGKFGIGIVNAYVGTIPLTTITGSGSTAAVIQTGATDYTSSIFIISYGSRLSRFLKNGAGDNVAVGLNLKYFLQGFTGGGASLQDANGGGMDADLGFIWETNRWMNLGLTLQNFLPVDFGGKFTWTRNSRVEGIPMVSRAGSQFRLLGPAGLRQNPEQRLDLVIDYEKSSALNRPAVWHAGIEYYPREIFTLRLGVDQKAKATNAGIGVDNNFTAGVGLEWGGFTFDYAYHQFGEIAENTTHFFSIGFKGQDRGEQIVAGKRAEKRKPVIPPAEVVPKPPLKNFADVPENYWAYKPIVYLATLAIMEGHPDGSFRPTREMTRGEMAVLLIKAKGFTVDKEIKIKFSDVPLQGFEAPYISLAVQRKYIGGYPDGTFQPDKRITRAEAALILAKFSGLYVKEKVSEQVYPDVPVGHWASPALAATKAIGAFEYLGGKGFGPNIYLTRAEAAEIISKTPFAKKKIEELLSGEK